jgi:hypothetical protein
MSLKKKINALEQDVAKASLESELVADQKYKIATGSTDYGCWTFNYAAHCRLYFSDKNGAILSIPKKFGKAVPHEDWLVIPEE